MGGCASGLEYQISVLVLLLSSASSVENVYHRNSKQNGFGKLHRRHRKAYSIMKVWNSWWDEYTNGLRRRQRRRGRERESEKDTHKTSTRDVGKVCPLLNSLFDAIQLRMKSARMVDFCVSFKCDVVAFTRRVCPISKYKMLVYSIRTGFRGGYFSNAFKVWKQKNFSKELLPKQIFVDLLHIILHTACFVYDTLISIGFVLPKIQFATCNLFEYAKMACITCIYEEHIIYIVNATTHSVDIICKIQAKPRDDRSKTMTEKRQSDSGERGTERYGTCASGK